MKLKKNSQLKKEKKLESTELTQYKKKLKQIMKLNL
jgi:hypothetical protein